MIPLTGRHVSGEGGHYTVALVSDYAVLSKKQ